MSDLFYEVKEAFEREKIEKIWKALRYPAIIISIIILIGISIYTVVQSKKIEKIHADQRVFHQVMMYLNANDVISAIDTLNFLIENGSNGYKIMALMLKANIHLKSKNYKSAKEIFHRVKDMNRGMVDLITCIESISIEVNESDIKILQAISEKNNYMGCMANIVLAHFFIKNKKFDDAKRSIAALSKVFPKVLLSAFWAHI